MNINTAADWWKLVEQTNPKLPEYATEHRRNWDADKAAKLDLCDLCSEAWTVYENVTA